jgi:hypothetical protein
MSASSRLEFTFAFTGQGQVIARCLLRLLDEAVENQDLALPNGKQDAGDPLALRGRSALMLSYISGMYHIMYVHGNLFR